MEEERQSLKDTASPMLSKRESQNQKASKDKTGDDHERLVKVQTWVTWVVISICFIAFSYQALKLTILFFKEPITTHIKSERNSLDDYARLMVCCKGQQCFSDRGDGSPGVKFARGYWLRQKLIVKESASGVYPTVTHMRSEMLKIGEDSVYRFLMRSSGIRSFSKDLDVGIGRVGAVEGNEMELPVIMGGSLNGKRDLVCFQLRHLSPELSNNSSDASNYLSRNLNSDGLFSLKIPNEAVFAFQTPSTYLYYLSFYTGGDWYSIPKSYFSQKVIPMSDLPGKVANTAKSGEQALHSTVGLTSAEAVSTLGSSKHRNDPAANVAIVYYRLTVEKNTKVSTSKKPCLENPPGTQYPMDFGQYECEQQCDDDVFHKLYGCTWSAILRNEPEGPNITYCNQWVHLRNASSQQKLLHVRLWEECFALKACDKRVYCSHWTLSLQQTTERGPVRSEVKNLSNADPLTTNTIRLKVFIPAYRTHVVEDYLITSEQWIGSVGGHLGMWIGLSVLTGIHAVTKFFFNACCAECGKTKKIPGDSPVSRKTKLKYATNDAKTFDTIV